MEYKKITGFLIVVLFLMAGPVAEAQTLEQIDIESFELKLENKKVMINWATPADATVNYFEIEKSTDGKEFKTFALVLGADPARPGSHFGYFDKVGKPSQKVYYRLKHVSENGDTQYSDVQTLLL